MDVNLRICGNKIQPSLPLPLPSSIKKKCNSTSVQKHKKTLSLGIFENKNKKARLEMGGRRAPKIYKSHRDA
jgi:hypothetical protein